MLDKILVGIIGLVTGGIGSLIAPWANWQVEKRRLRFQRRKDAIAEWREMCMSWRYFAPSNHPEPLHLNLTRSWNSLKPHLKKSVLDELLKYGETPISYEQRDQLAALLLDDIARLERKWGLA